MAKLYNLAAMTVASTGTGTITLGSAATINGVLYLSFASAGVSNGEVVAYSINDIGGSEVGTGTYTSAGTTLSRTPITSTNSNNAINMTSAAIVRISPAKEDIANLRESNTFTGALNIIPTLAGGSGAGSSLTLESTSGAGTTDFIAFLTGSQVEKARFTTAGDLLQGITSAPSLGDSANGIRYAIQGTGGLYGYLQIMTDTTGIRETGRFSFGSPAFSGGDKRTAVLQSNSTTSSTTNPSGDFRFYTANGSGLAQTALLSPGRGLIVGGSTTEPGAGTLAGSGGFQTGSPATKTTNYTMTDADSSLIFNGSGSITLTLLAAATYPGREILLKNIAAFTVVSASSNVVPQAGGAAGTAILAATAGKWARLKSDATNWQIMSSN